MRGMIALLVIAALVGPVHAETLRDRVTDFFKPKPQIQFTVGPVQTMPDSDLTIDVLTKRLRSLDAKPKIRQEGSVLQVRVVVEGDARAIRQALTQPGRLSMHVVARELGSCDGVTLKGMLCLAHPSRPDQVYLLPSKPDVAGPFVREARADTDQAGRPVVSLRMSETGAQAFGAVTAAATGKLLAVVLDGAVVMAPRIQEPILGGALWISGSFTIEETRTLAAILSQPPLPEPLQILAEEVVPQGE